MAFHVVVLESRHDFCLAKMEDLLDVDMRTRLPNGRFFLDCHYGAAHGRDSLAWLEAEALTIKPQDCRKIQTRAKMFAGTQASQHKTNLTEGCKQSNRRDSAKAAPGRERIICTSPDQKRT